MPYVSRSQRESLEELVHAAGNWSDLTVSHEGELNYLITTLCGNYLRRNAVNYGTINTVIGVLECAKLEMYRRLAGPYEDEKIAENGDMPLYLGRRQ